MPGSYLLNLNLFIYYVYILFKYILNLLNTSLPPQNFFSWSCCYKIVVVITSFIEMLELPNFDNRSTSTLKFDLRDKILLMTS